MTEPGPWRALELKIPPLLWLALSAAAMYAIALAFPQWRLPLPPGVRAGLAALWVLAGMAIALLGVRAFRRQRASLNPMQPQAATELVATGVLAHSRNPMYLGMALCLGGWALWLAHPLALIGVALFGACLHWLQIKPEERILRDKFGQAHADYCQRVRRWF